MSGSRKRAGLAVVVSTVALVTVPLVSAVSQPAGAVTATCQGRAATIEGPTSGDNTLGTEGDDVIVAPLYANTLVDALGGNDTICLVDSTRIGSRDPFVVVRAGTGDDSVVNQTTAAPATTVELGEGADRYFGNALPETVWGATSSGVDIADDLISTGGGSDAVITGTPGFANHDVIDTGEGDDRVSYGGLAGGAIVDGPSGVDSLYLRDSWSGALVVDNVSRQATVGGVTELTWTGPVRSFAARAVPGSWLSFVGTADDEWLSVAGTVLDLAAPAATLATGGGDDFLSLENYLPGSLDAGDGYDILSLRACSSADVRLGSAVGCLTDTGSTATTGLSGVEYLSAATSRRLTVHGTDGADRIDASSRRVLVRSGAGDDRVVGGGRRVWVYAGAGDDTVRGASAKGVTLAGQGGDDVLRGSPGPDVLRGGLGTDTAYGWRGRDVCLAEVRHGCEQDHL